MGEDFIARSPPLEQGEADEKRGGDMKGSWCGTLTNSSPYLYASERSPWFEWPLEARHTGGNTILEKRISSSRAV